MSLEVAEKAILDTRDEKSQDRLLVEVIDLAATGEGAKETVFDAGVPPDKVWVLVSAAMTPTNKVYMYIYRSEEVEEKYKNGINAGALAGIANEVPLLLKPYRHPDRIKIEVVNKTGAAVTGFAYRIRLRQFAAQGGGR